MMPQANTQSRIESVLSFEDAQRTVLSHANQVRSSQNQIEQVPILDSLGRVLAQHIVADRDFPPFPRATRDGYAVRSEDVQRVPVELKVAGEVRAGGNFPPGFIRLATGDALSIMTGAPVPDGADAVVMVEYTGRVKQGLRVLRSVAARENIVARGSEAKRGSTLVAQGTVISHPQIALAASVGKSLVGVYSRPRVAILPTGDEIVPIDAEPAANQIRNSNSFSLAAQVTACAGEPVQLPIAPDARPGLRELIAQGLESDLLLLSGGVSAGEYDLVEDALAEFSAEFLFSGVQIQPGKPLVFGRAHPRSNRERWTYFFGLPGNPISTMVTFQLFASVLIRALAGASEPATQGRKMRLRKDVKTKTGLTRFLPGKISGSWDDPQVELLSWHGSGDVAAFAQADCLLVIPPDRDSFKSGEWMTVLPIES
jgi:molybdopterin molybdotransferase